MTDVEEQVSQMPFIFPVAILVTFAFACILLLFVTDLYIKNQSLAKRIETLESRR